MFRHWQQNQRSALRQTLYAVSGRILFTILFDGMWYMFGLYSWWFGVSLFVFSFRTESVFWLSHEHWRKENESVNRTTYLKLLYSISSCQFHLLSLHEKYMRTLFIKQSSVLVCSRVKLSAQGSDHLVITTLCGALLPHYFFLFLSFCFFVGHDLEPPWSWTRAGMQKDIAYVSPALRSDCGILCMAFMLLWSFYYYWDLCCLEYFLEHLLLLTFFDRMMYLRA